MYLLFIVWLLCLIGHAWGAFIVLTIMLIVFGLLELNIQTTPLPHNNKNKKK